MTNIAARETDGRNNVLIEPNGQDEGESPRAATKDGAVNA